jgi:hypothetical protein
MTLSHLQGLFLNDIFDDILWRSEKYIAPAENLTKAFQPLVHL